MYQKQNGMCVTIQEASKTRDQEGKYQAICGDIARACMYMAELCARKWKAKTGSTSSVMRSPR